MSQHSHSQSTAHQTTPLTVRIQPRPWQDSAVEPTPTDHPAQAPIADLSHVDLFSHAPQRHPVRSPLQCKLTMDQPRDTDEAADRGAETVAAIAPPASPLIQRSLEGKSGTVQRVTIPGQQIVQDLGTIQGLKDALSDAAALPQGVTFDQYITRMLTQYEQTFQQANDAASRQDNAAKVALIVRALARDLARKLGNPWLAPELGEQIVNYYGADITAMLNQGGDTDHAETKALAGTLASADPVMLHMTDKITKDEAAKKIAQMAQDRAMQPSAMFELLNRQFQLEIGTFTQAEINTGKLSNNLPGGHTPVSGQDDLIGEISPTFFAKVADIAGNGNTQWDGNGLKLTNAAMAKLTDLSQAVNNVNVVVPGPLPVVAGRANLTQQQQRYIHTVEQQEQGMNMGNLRTACNTALQDLYAIAQPEADQLITQYVNRFDQIPLTTTFDADVMFANAQNNITYKSALKRETQQKALSQILPTRSDGQVAGGNVETIGQPGGMAQHRNNPAYIRWRYEKDVKKPPGYGGLSVTELPEFGALSPSFKIAQGSEDLNRVTFGQNQYGSSHFVYKPAVRSRAMYQLTATGALRRDPIVLLHDILVGSDQNFNTAQANRNQAKINFDNAPQPTDAATRQQRTAAVEHLKNMDAELQRARTKRVQALNISHALMSFIIDGNMTFLDQQQIEVQIFGDVKIETDVEKIVVKNAGPVARQNLNQFAQLHNIQVIDTAQPANTQIQAVNTQSANIDAAWMVQRYLHNIQDEWIPTLAEWKDESKLKGKVRSGLLSAVDTAVNNYEALRHDPTPANHHAPLQAILTAIGNWKNSKNNRSDRWGVVLNLEAVTTRMLNMMQNL